MSNMAKITIPRAIVTGSANVRLSRQVVDVSPEYRALHPNTGPPQIIETGEPRVRVELDLPFDGEIGKWLVDNMGKLGKVTFE